MPLKVLRKRIEMSKSIKIVEVGPRDGLQNEAQILSHNVRLEFGRRLADAGIKKLELGAFVSPKWVPQMAGSAELFDTVLKLQKNGRFPRDVELSALVPNIRGMEDALAAGVRHVAVFGSASESFSKRNINCSIEESFERFAAVVDLAKQNRVKVRGYLSMCFGCPFEGEVSEAVVVKLAKRLVKMGIYEVSIGDTIGVADPGQVRRLGAKLVRAVGADKLAMHFHNTRGIALANILASLDLGIRVFDSSLGGLGGCPYAPGAAGNVATEDVVYMLQEMGLKTGLDLPKLIALNHWMADQMGRPLPSSVGKAGLPKSYWQKHKAK
jgi:hydroxymethylglutaryl-CoA lyase